jgi:hypothetical protein
VAVAEVEDDSLERAPCVHDERVAGHPGRAQGLHGDLPRGVEIGVELTDGR